MGEAVNAVPREDEGREAAGVRSMHDTGRKREWTQKQAMLWTGEVREAGPKAREKQCESMQICLSRPLINRHKHCAAMATTRRWRA